MMGHLVSLQFGIPQASAHEIVYNMVSFWVQLHGLPLEFMTTKNAAKVATLLEEVQEVENLRVERVLLRSFMRTGPGDKVETRGLGRVPPEHGTSSIFPALQQWRVSSGRGEVAQYRDVPNMTNGPSFPFCQEALKLQMTPQGVDVVSCIEELEGPEGSRKKGEPNPNETTQPTRVDLECGVIRSGLGPASLQHLNLEKDHIGLYQPIVCLDYKSPQRRYEGVNLSPIDVRNYKEAFRKMEWGEATGKAKAKRSNPSSTSSDNMEEETQLHFVDFPQEEDDCANKSPLLTRKVSYN
ncbi:hypothetical protein SESBI_05776 [Sesbania bispinosa]|nr:hypothetical protein SESBI_05776 [Sesbania bispinosa]